MKRYRFSRFYIDTTRNALKIPGLTPEARKKEEHQLSSSIFAQYGELSRNEKFKRYMDVDPPDLSVVFELHEHLLQISDAYITCADFPAYTSACCLGERIFNLLIFRLRDNFRHLASYRRIANKESTDNWDLGIALLREWDLIEPETETAFNELKKLRHSAIHSGSLEDLSAKAKAAIQLIHKISKCVFGLREDIFFRVAGEFYIRKNREEAPLVKEFFIPSCSLVSPRHASTLASGTYTFTEPDTDDGKDGSDEEFSKLRTEWKRQRG